MNSRLQKLRKLLQEHQLDAVLVSDLANITYLTTFNGFSTEDRDAFLLITKKNQYIFTHAIYREIVEKKIKHFTLIDIKRENPISRALKTIIEVEKINKLGFEAFDLKVTDYKKLTEQINNELLQSVNLIGQLRITKDHNEVLAIKKACQLGDKVFDFIVSKLKIGVTEIELAVEIEYFIKKHGADISFPPIVAFGPNASQPHHVPDKTKLKKNNFVLFDFGTKLNNYCSDMTRTVFFGKANKQQQHLYNTVLTAQSTSVNYLKNKLSKKQTVHAPTIDQAGRDYISEQGYEPFNHSSHGIGLNVHEAPHLYPISKDTMADGMVFSIEPGIYLAGKFGIRIEDIYAIENNKLTQLTKAPKKFIEIEA